MKEIEDFLRENKPVVKDNPTATAIAFLYPIDADSVGKGVLDSIRLFLTTWKQYLLLPVALLAIALSLVLMSGKRGKSTF